MTRFVGGNRRGGSLNRGGPTSRGSGGRGFMNRAGNINDHRGRVNSSGTSLNRGGTSETFSNNSNRPVGRVGLMDGFRGGKDSSMGSNSRFTSGSANAGTFRQPRDTANRESELINTKKNMLIELSIFSKYYYFIRSWGFISTKSMVCVNSRCF